MDSYLVLDGILAVGQPPLVYLSVTGNFNSPCTFLTDAEVWLCSGQQRIETLAFDTAAKAYVGICPLDENKPYTCFALVDGDTVSGTTNMPVSKSIYSVDIIEDAGINDDGDIYSAFDVTFENDPNRQCYYQLTIRGYRWWSYGQCWQTSVFDDSYRVEDPVLMHEGSGYLVFSNEIISGDHYTIRFSDYGHISHGEYNYFLADLRTLSYDYYMYLKSLRLYDDIDNLSQDFFTPTQLAPRNIYSNVDGGFGIVGAYASAVSDTIHY